MVYRVTTEKHIIYIGAEHVTPWLRKVEVMQDDFNHKLAILQSLIDDNWTAIHWTAINERDVPAGVMLYTPGHTMQVALGDKEMDALGITPDRAITPDVPVNPDLRQYMRRPGESDAAMHERQRHIKAMIRGVPTMTDEEAHQAFDSIKEDVFSVRDGRIIAGLTSSGAPKARDRSLADGRFVTYDGPTEMIVLPGGKRTRIPTSQLTNVDPAVFPDTGGRYPNTLEAYNTATPYQQGWLAYMRFDWPGCAIARMPNPYPVEGVKYGEWVAGKQRAIDWVSSFDMVINY
jgi:hypothetical protein